MHAGTLAHRSAARSGAVVAEALRAPGQQLEDGVRTVMSQRFGHHFNEVRVHADALAAQSARAVGASAYTVGHDIVFGQDRYQPATAAGRQLLAHELTHVVQQGSVAPAARPGQALTLDPADSSGEREARRIEGEAGGPGPVRTAVRQPAPTVARADPQAVQLTRQLGRTIRTGIRFWPANITDTRVGPVTAQGGPSGGASQLHVIVAGNLTLRALAAELRPLWITATPFTPPGAGAPLPLDIVSQDEIAQALLVFNRTFLPVPAMTSWRAGLLFPLPAEVDPMTGVVTLHPLQIRDLAAAFDPAWTPLLDLRAGAGAAVPAATLAADVTAFLAREPDAAARGIQLAVRALTNATSELPFVRETFRQLGAASFDVGLAFMDQLVNPQIQALAAERDGAAILAAIRTALAAAPAVRTAAQQASLDRANVMLGLVAGTAAAPPPVDTRGRAMKTLTVDTVRLHGSTHNPATDVAIANAIFAQCNVRIQHGVDATATEPETRAWLGGNLDLAADAACAASPEVSTLVPGATARFGLGARIRVFYPATFGPAAGRGFSWPASCGPVPSKRNTVIVQNAGTERTLAHEIGHILLNPGPHQAAATQNVMAPTAVAPLAVRFTDADCTAIYFGF